MKLLRKSGYTVDPCERWIPHTQIRRDLFGFADIVAIRPGITGVLAIQATTADHVSHRLEKAKKLVSLSRWLACNNQFEIHGWKKTKDGKWEVRRVAVTGADLKASELERPVSKRKKRERDLFEKVA